MERMERTVRTSDTARPAAMRAKALDEFSDVPAWDLLDVPASTIESLRGEVSALRERLANAAPKRAMVEMDRAVSLLARRVEDVRAAGAARDGADRAFEDELAAIRAGLEQLRNPERFRALETGLDALARKIELVGARAVDPVEVARLQGQVGEIHDLVARSLDGPQGQGVLHGALQTLSDRLTMCADAVTRTGEDAARRVAEATGAFERNAEALLERVMQAEGRARAGDSAAMEELRRSLIGALQGVHRRLDQVADHISGQVSSLSPAVGADVAQRLGALAQRMAAAEEASRAAVAPLAEAMDRHFVNLSEQLREAQAQLGRLDDIDAIARHLAGLSEQFRDARARLGRLDDLDAMERHLVGLSEQFRSANARLGRLDGLDAMERHLASLTEHFRGASARLGRLDNLDVMERHLAALTEQFRSASARLGRLDGLDAMERHIASLSEQLRSASGRLDGLDAMERHMAGLTEQFRSASGRLDGMDAMERHLASLTEQFRDAHARLDRLDGIETSLQQMADEMRRVREVTHTATAEAVAAMAAKVAEDPEGAAVVGLKRGLAALEARQDEIERRAGEILANELEHELRDISVSLGRDEDGTFAPRTAAAPDAAYAPDEPRDPAYGADERPAPMPDFADELSATVAPEAAAPVNGAVDDAMFDIPWPHAAQRDAPHRPDRAASPHPEDDAVRPKLDHRARGKRAEKPRAAKPGLFTGGLFARRRHVAMVALIAGATTVFAGVAAGLAWRNGPQFISGLTQAARRLSAPAVAGVVPSELPAPVGPAALQAAARNGDPAAAFRVAARYAEGQGVEANLDAAVKWLAFAMQRGSAPAAHRLGALYESAGRDLNEAKRFYQWAAEQGNVRAMQALAMLLSDGTAGQKPDWAGAVHWFKAAAELGYRDAQYNLGVVYARGLGVSADFGEAYKWLSLAAAQGDEDSARKREIIAREADGITMLKAQKAVEAFAPAPQIPAANTVEMRPEWEDDASTDKVAVAPTASRKSSTRLASSAPSDR